MEQHGGGDFLVLGVVMSVAVAVAVCAGFGIVMQGRHRRHAAALGDHVAGAVFTLAALGGHTQFKLNIVKTHPGTRMARDLAVRHSTANTDDHDAKRVTVR